MSDDLLLNVTVDSSFKFKAKVAQGGEIFSDFAITPTEETTPTPPGTPNTPNGAQPPKPAPAPNPSASNEGDWTPHAPTRGRGLHGLNGIFGTGDATLNLASFSGTVYLRSEERRVGKEC